MIDAEHNNSLQQYSRTSAQHVIQFFHILLFGCSITQKGCQCTFHSSSPNQRARTKNLGKNCSLFCFCTAHHKPSSSLRNGATYVVDGSRKVQEELNIHSTPSSKLLSLLNAWLVEGCVDKICDEWNIKLVPCLPDTIGRALLSPDLCVCVVSSEHLQLESSPPTKTPITQMRGSMLTSKRWELV